MSVRILSVLGLAGLLSASVACSVTTVPLEEYNKMATAQKEYIGSLEQRNQDLETQNQELLRQTDDRTLARTADELYAQIARQLESALKELGDDDDAMTFKNGVWSLGTDLLFETGSWTVSDKGRAILKKFAEAHRAQNLRYRIVGHTDRAPIVSAPLKNKLDTDTNMELSARRAIAVMGVLKACGMPESAFAECVGMGNSAPRAANDKNPANMKKNRRVEIYVLGKATLPVAAEKTPEKKARK